MRPFHFQIVSVAHHSWGAMQAMQNGTFRPPSSAFDEDEVEAIGRRRLVFEVGEQELPFTNQNFLLSFSLPSFYFHATTTYDILRMLGVSLAKGDFLGARGTGPTKSGV